MVEEIVRLFKKFYNEHYEEQLEAIENQNYGILQIDYKELEDYNKMLAEDIGNNPTSIIYNANTALEELTDAEPVQIILENYDMIEVGISDLRDKHIGKLVKLEGTVSQTTSIVPKADVATFECTNGHITKVKQSLQTDLEYPTECSDGECSKRREREFRLKPTMSSKINFQKLEIQEPHEEVTGGDTPESISLHVRGTLAGSVTAGDRVSITGIYRATEQSGTSIFATYVRGYNIEAEQKEFKEIEISDEDIQQIKNLSNDDKIYEKMVSSIAPAIKGLDGIKEAVAYQLFRGVRKSKMNTNIRGDIHILMVGDPSVGKSQILRYVSEVAPRAVMTSGQGASEAGLTVSAVRDSDMGEDDEWRLKAGSMVLADEGIACIDELDKMDSSDRTSMFEGLEQQTISVAKAGITATLKSRCALLGAANPKEGRWNKYDPISAQIDLEPPLVSRFDLIFAPQDEANEDKDRELADHILRTNKYGQQLEAGVDDPIESKEIKPEIPPELLKKYVAYARSNCNPVLTEQAKSTLQEFFVNIRNDAEGEDNIPITARKIEGLVRISEAVARIQLSDKVQEHHAKRAINIVKESLKDVGYDEEAERFDIDKIESGNTVTQRKRKKALLDTIRDMMDEGEKGAPKENVIETLTEKGFEKTNIKELITKETRKGEIYEPKKKELKLLE